MKHNHWIARAVLAGALAWGGIPAAFAHAFLDHAVPAVGSTVRAPPAEVRVWFTEAVEPAFSSITVSDAAGHAVSQGKAQRDPANAAELRVVVGTLPPGTYTVNWRVVSVDTHRTEGNFTFTVAP